MILIAAFGEMKIDDGGELICSSVGLIVVVRFNEMGIEEIISFFGMKGAAICYCTRSLIIPIIIAS